MRWDQGALQRFRSIVGSSLGLLGADRLIDRQDRHAGRKGRLRCVVRDALLCFEDSGVSAFLALPPLVCRKCVCWGGYSLESTRTGKKHRSQEYFSPAFWTAQGGVCMRVYPSSGYYLHVSLLCSSCAWEVQSWKCLQGKFLCIKLINKQRFTFFSLFFFFTSRWSYAFFFSFILLLLRVSN